MGGCGCSLVGISIIAWFFAVLFAYGMWNVDEKAGLKNERDWAAYTAQVEQWDSIADESVRDSLIESLPAPPIRQGGFAAGFGLLAAMFVIVVSLLPLGIGICLLSMRRKVVRQERKEQQSWNR